MQRLEGKRAQHREKLEGILKGWGIKRKLHHGRSGEQRGEQGPKSEECINYV